MTVTMYIMCYILKNFNHFGILYVNNIIAQLWFD
jgi:hypothetical protein